MITWPEVTVPDPAPHFPDPDASPIAILEAAIIERDERISELYAEAKAWQRQLEDALARIDQMNGAALSVAWSEP